MAGFIDQMKSEGFAVESICRVLRQQGCYRSWKRGGVAARTLSDAHVADKVRDLAWTTKQAQRQMTPEGLYGRRKMTALVRRQPAFGDASAGSVDRAMTVLGLSGVRRDKGIRTTIPGKDGNRAGDLLDRDSTAPAAGSHLGDGLHLRPDVGGVLLRRVHRRCVLATHRRLARRWQHAHRPGP